MLMCCAFASALWLGTWKFASKLCSNPLDLSSFCSSCYRSFPFPLWCCHLSSLGLYLLLVCLVCAILWLSLSSNFFFVFRYMCPVLASSSSSVFLLRSVTFLLLIFLLCTALFVMSVFQSCFFLFARAFFLWCFLLCFRFCSVGLAHWLSATSAGRRRPHAHPIAWKNICCRWPQASDPSLLFFK